jgi:hypothetical protein
MLISIEEIADFLDKSTKSQYELGHSSNCVVCQMLRKKLDTQAVQMIDFYKGSFQKEGKPPEYFEVDKKFGDLCRQHAIETNLTGWIHKDVLMQKMRRV